MQLLRVDSLPDLIAQKKGHWRCMSKKTVAWRSAPVFDHRLEPPSGPEGGNVVEAELVKGEQGNWLQVSTDSSPRFLPVATPDGEVLFVKEATIGTVRTIFERGRRD